MLRRRGRQTCKVNETAYHLVFPGLLFQIAIVCNDVRDHFYMTSFLYDLGGTLKCAYPLGSPSSDRVWLYVGGCEKMGTAGNHPGEVYNCR